MKLGRFFSFSPRERLFPSSFALIDRRFGALCVMGSSRKRTQRSLVGVRLLPKNIPIAIGFFVVIALLLELRLVESCEIKIDKEE